MSCAARRPHGKRPPTAAQAPIKGSCTSGPTPRFATLRTPACSCRQRSLPLPIPRGTPDAGAKQAKLYASRWFRQYAPKAPDFTPPLIAGSSLSLALSTRRLPPRHGRAEGDADVEQGAHDGPAAMEATGAHLVPSDHAWLGYVMPCCWGSHAWLLPAPLSCVLLGKRIDRGWHLQVAAEEPSAKSRPTASAGCGAARSCCAQLAETSALPLSVCATGHPLSLL